MSEWSVRICFWISFFFCSAVLSTSFCECVYEWCISERIVRMLWRICLNDVRMSECSVRICFWISFFFFRWSCLNPSVKWCIVRMLWRICLNMYECLKNCQDLNLSDVWMFAVPGFGFLISGFFLLGGHVSLFLWKWCMNVWTNC